MKAAWRKMIPVLLTLTALSCASLRRDPGSENALRRMIQQESGVELKAIQYEEQTGTAVVQLRSTRAEDEGRVSYRWYALEDGAWVLAPYVGVKRPDAP